MFPEHRCYVEPYGGGGSVLLRKERSYAEVYNDLDGEIVNLFRVARDSGPELARLLELTPFARDEFKLSYEATNDPVEQARRTLVRSFMGFGSNSHNKATGFRSNSNRSRTTPAHDWMNYPKALHLTIERLQGVVIENAPALSILPTHDSETTLFYVDPPYLPETRDAGTDYRHEMTDQDHRDMASALHRLKGMVVVSGYACDLYDNELFRSWERFERASLADGARKRTEILWVNSAVSSKRSNMLRFG